MALHVFSSSFSCLKSFQVQKLSGLWEVLSSFRTNVTALRGAGVDSAVGTVTPSWPSVAVESSGSTMLVSLEIVMERVVNAVDCFDRVLVVVAAAASVRVVAVVIGIVVVVVFVVIVHSVTHAVGIVRIVVASLLACAMSGSRATRHQFAFPGVHRGCYFLIYSLHVYHL